MRFMPFRRGTGASGPSGNLFQRVLSAAALAAIIGSGLLFFNEFFFTVGTMVFVALGLFEFFTMLRERRAPCYRLFGVSIGSLLPLIVFLQEGLTQSGDVWFIVLSSFALFIVQFSRKDNPQALEAIALTLFGIMYVGWFLSFVIKIRFLPMGSLWLGYLFVVTKAGDIAAYAVGRLWGRHALIPHISPRKTLEGMWGGLIASAGVSALFRPLLPVEWPWITAAGIGFILGLLGQCGDLSSSLIKRYCGVKDSGRMVPGFGGFLDVMDSVLFTVPMFFFYLKAHLFI